ncbi:MAG: electron transfer flavoprotein subunit alpha/FixB family protein, partial [Chloroflexi bacterium]|nr:electron transfer flavoprotein subunit alpha/FixB family protein [Chloroflexota bacterium]
KPGRATPEQIQAAKNKTIEVIEPRALASDLNLFGLAGSPTWVTEIYTIEPKRKHIVRTLNGDADAAAQVVVRDLMEEGLFGEWKNRAPENFSPGDQNWQGDAIWVVAEIIEGKIRPVTFEMLGRATQLAEKINGYVAAVLIGDNVSHLAKTLAAYGATKVLLAEDATLAAYDPEIFTTILANAIRARNPYAVLIPSTANGRDFAPRVAARLNIGLTGDVIGLEIDDQKRLVQLKPAFGGNIVAPILSQTRPAMATIRPGLLPSAVPDPERKAQIEKLAVEKTRAPRTRVIATEVIAPEGIELDRARIIVTVGMGIGTPENLPVVRALAAALDARIGATRRVVDAGWLPRQQQIGLTGRAVAPHLYVTVGVSGKFNHAVGMQRAGIVLAINNNPEAEIFKHADYGIVGDWAMIVPALTRALVAAHPK